MADESYTHVYSVTDCCNALHGWWNGVHTCNECDGVDPTYHEAIGITIKVGDRVAFTESYCKWAPYSTDEALAERGAITKLGGNYPTIKWEHFQKDTTAHISNIRLVQTETEECTK